jgi:AcrR family transcriptional regulator
METSVGRKRGQAGRAALVRAAIALFSRKGFEDTSVEEICLAAGYSKGGFYFHFAGKDDLLSQLLDAATDLTHTHISGAFAAELWAEAGRDEAVRRRLAELYKARAQDLLNVPSRVEETHGNAPDLAGLLLLLDTGLDVQRRVLVTPANDAQDVIDSLIASLGERLPEKSQRAAGAGC